MQRADIRVLDELLHDDLAFHLPTGECITKAADFATYRSGNMTIETLKATDQHIRLVYDIATVSVIVALKGRYYDQVIDGRMRYLRVWAWGGEGWQVVAGSCVAV